MPEIRGGPWAEAWAAWGTVSNLGIFAIGAGILGFPFAFGKLGLIGGTFACVLVSFLALCTLNILARQAAIHNARNYQDLVKEGLGNKWHIPWGAVTSLAIVLLGYGSCVAYLQIVGDNFKDIGGGLITYLNSQPWWFLPPIPDTNSYQRNIPILVLATFVALPYSLPRQMKALEPIATFGVTCMVFCALVVGAKALIALKAGDIHFESVDMVKFSDESLRAIPIMVFAYSCHVPSVELFYDLPNNASLFACLRRRPCPPCPEQCCLPRRMNIRDEGRSETEMQSKLPCITIIYAVTFAACTLLYLIAGVGGYLLFPESDKSDILVNFHDKFMVTMREIIAFAVLLHYPINSHTARSAAYDLICAAFGLQPNIDRAPLWQSHALTLAVFVASVYSACITDDLGTTFALLGGVCSCTVVIIMPGLLALAYAMKFRKRQTRTVEPLLTPYPVEFLNKSFLESAAMGCVVTVSGLLILVATLYVTWVYHDEKNGDASPT